ncbi:MAG: ferrous iron transporter B [Flavobacteriales bacterium]|nr:ferrous iron transporter B [Flavobacteriales bacterium]
MSEVSVARILITGTPNSGKTTIFNRLTGLHQHTANFPGVTTSVSRGRIRWQKSSGHCLEAECLDLPGIYSLYPDTPDEREAVQCIRHALSLPGPQCVVFVADPTTPHRTVHLLLHLQEYIHIDLVVFNFWDVAEKEGISFNEKAFVRLFGPHLRYCFHNPRNHVHLRTIRNALASILEAKSHEPFRHPLLQATLQESPDTRIARSTALYRRVRDAANEIFPQKTSPFSSPINPKDKVFLHPFWGTLIFFGFLFLIFQAIFSWTNWPMRGIEWLFSRLSAALHTVLPPGPLTHLLADGVVQGLSGILVFVPQIAFLLFFLALMEESGYMARAVALMDRLMRRFGLSGRSVVPLLGGAACAVPSILATRSIPNPRQRLITILVIPLMSCSARLPVYTLLLGLLLPDSKVVGLDVRGLALMIMYLLGFCLAVGAAWLFSRMIPQGGKDYLIMSLPHLQRPLPLVVLSKTWVGLKAFVLGAGRIILFLSVILWVMMHFGPGDLGIGPKPSADPAQRLKESWAGYAGRLLEPAIRPIGGDWRIGIALVSSFAAREVFAGTVATLFPPPPGQPLRSHLSSLQSADGRRIFSPATCLALLVFYAIALQCLSTVATVHQETRSWRWPLIQFVIFMMSAWLAAAGIYRMADFWGLSV